MAEMSDKARAGLNLIAVKDQMGESYKEYLFSIHSMFDDVPPGVVVGMMQDVCNALNDEVAGRAAARPAGIPSYKENMDVTARVIGLNVLYQALANRVEAIIAEDLAKGAGNQ